jgi:hypothetical protein
MEEHAAISEKWESIRAEREAAGTPAAATPDDAP